MPKIGIDWLYFSGKNKAHLEKRNRYRQRIGMPAILDEGSLAYLKFYIGPWVLDFTLDIRPTTWEVE